MKKSFIVLLIIIVSFFQHGCTKFVQVDPPTTELVSSVVYQNDVSAAAVLTGIYSFLSATGATFSGGQGSIGYLCGNAADEFTNYLTSGVPVVFYGNSYNPSSNLSALFWTELYEEIYVANAALEGLSNSTGVSTSLKAQLQGEAKFIRALLYFYATNLYGDVPLLTTSNYLVNNTAPRTPSVQVYQQIVSDLLDAQNLLSDNFVDQTGAITTERVRPNKGAAASLLSRVYLYEQKWDSAVLEASSVISNSSLYALDTLNGVFLKNSVEGIWELQSITPGLNTYDGYFYVLTSAPGTGQYSVTISPQLLNAFEPGDNRLNNWIGSFTSSGQTYLFPYKYKQGTYDATIPVTEYNVVLRLAEQYLIRAEAEAQLGNLAGAAADLNIIRNRAGLGNTTATTQSDLLSAIYHERQVELFTEWGHRWFDLIRTGNVNPVMTVVTPQKGGVWAPYKILLPISAYEIQANPKLTQNPGYN